MHSQEKIVRLGALKQRIRGFRRKKKSIAFTNGCFDILHSGHVRYLEAAKGRDRILIVGLNSDSSVRKIKGPGRPIVPQRARAAVLAALQCVDYVIIFPETTPYRIIKELEPDLLIKGADWKGKEVVGRDIVEARGGRVLLIKYLPGFSTTNIIQAIKERG